MNKINKILSLFLLSLSFLLLLNFAYPSEEESYYLYCPANNTDTCDVSITIGEGDPEEAILEFDYYNIDVINIYSSTGVKLDYFHTIPKTITINALDATDFNLNLNLHDYEESIPTIKLNIEHPTNTTLNISKTNANILITVNKISFYEDVSLDINYDNSIIHINTKIEDLNITNLGDRLYLKFKSAEEINLNKLNVKNVVFNNVQDFNLNLKSNFNIFNNKVFIDKSNNVIINGFDYNKIHSLNLTEPKSMISINDSNNIIIQGFKLYSDKGKKNNKLTYIDINKSQVIIKNNVFNDVNNPIKNLDSNTWIYSNSFYNVEKVFNTSFKNSKILFFNNFLNDIKNLSNLTYLNNEKYSLSLDANKSIGPVLDGAKYECSENEKIIDNVFNSNKLADRNIPIYYYNTTNNEYVAYDYGPQCFGGNLYANKVIPDICGNDCFLFLFEGRHQKPDLIYDFPNQYSHNQNIIDKAPLILPKEKYGDYIYETSDDLLDISFEIKSKKKIYSKNDKINFLVRIKPKDILYRGELFRWLLAGEITFNFKNLLINNTINIPIDENVNANAFETCDKPYCKGVKDISYKFEIVFDNLNFDLNKLQNMESSSTKTKNIEFKLNYDFNNYNLICKFMKFILDDCDSNPTPKFDCHGYDVLLKDYQELCFKSLSITQEIPFKIEGSAPTIRTPDNNVWVVALLSLSVISIYLFSNRKKQSKDKQCV